MNRSFFAFLLVLSLALTGRAQQFPGNIQNPNGFGGRQAMPTSTTGIGGIDDSTKVIYGPKSTRYVLEDDIFNNRRKLYTMDTTMDDVHRFTYVQRSQNLYQDLGTLGTPIRPVFVQEPDQLGAQSGYTVFAPYAYS
ncbi:putative porin, partial [Spirosoma sp.]|uniref:putative porin n=1 Tax=Spirosoma sp. TaxID=1899569 RepID=UPI003B3B8B94